MRMVRICWKVGERYIPLYGRKKPGDEFVLTEAEARAFIRQGDAEEVTEVREAPARKKGKEVTADE